MADYTDIDTIKSLSKIDPELDAVSPNPPPLPSPPL
jgi:hypothetical protein